MPANFVYLRKSWTDFLFLFFEVDVVTSQIFNTKFLVWKPRRKKNSENGSRYRHTKWNEDRRMKHAHENWPFKFEARLNHIWDNSSYLKQNTTFSITNISWLVLWLEIIPVHSKYRTKLKYKMQRCWLLKQMVHIVTTRF